MSYQSIRTAHIAGIPPGCDPQRDTENFTQYQARMYAQGLRPDIDDGESDADYETRMAALYFVVAPWVNITSSYALSDDDTQDTVLSASYASSSSYTTTWNNITQSYIASASWVSASAKITTADTASYIAVANVSGIPTTAYTASYIAVANVSGTPTSATSASYILSTGISGTPVLATSSSYVSGSGIFTSGSLYLIDDAGVLRQIAISASVLIVS